MNQLLSTNLLEICAVLFGIANIYLCVRASVWNWFFGILMLSLYTIIFFQVKLYADMFFQLVALALQFYGLKTWLTKNKAHVNLAISHAGNHNLQMMGLAVLILFPLIAFILANYTDSTTVYIDALTTAASLVALWMQVKKWVEHWLVWIVIDIGLVNMYLIKNLYYTAGLNAFFMLLCVVGYLKWREQLFSSKQTVPSIA